MVCPSKRSKPRDDWLSGVRGAENDPSNVYRNLSTIPGRPIGRPFLSMERAMTDRNQAETMYPNQQGRWRIELRYLPIAHRGHAFLALVDPDGRPVRELHGLAHSQHSGERMVMGMDGAHLRAGDYSGSPIGGHKVTLATVGSGSKEEIDKIWEKGSAAARTITAGKFDYKAHDPSYEVGTDGGQIQNSNSVAFTLGKAMGLDLDRAIRDAGMSRRFSGWGRDLLDPKYERYVTPPTFPVKDAP